MVDGLNRFSGNWLNRWVYGPATYNQDGLVSAHNADFMSDRRFREAYARGAATGSWSGSLHWRAYVYCWAAMRGMAIPGDFAECGVNRGGYALTAILYTDFPARGKRFFLLDTFDDLPAEQISAAERQRGIGRGAYGDCYEDVLRTFAPFAAETVVVRGKVPETLSRITAERLAFLSLDMNLREPEVAAAEYLWEKLSPGAAILLDDYGWRKHEEQKHAFDQFAARRDVPLLALPTGQALILKP